MMRTIAAILALSPVLLHAQAKTPAQPVSTPVLQSSNVQPAVFAATNAVAAGTTTSPVRVSTGVVVPQILHASNVDIHHILPSNGSRTIVVALTVDPTGKPANLKVVQGADKFTDQGVLDAVSQYVYKPGTLDGQPVPMDVTLHYVIQ